MSKEVYKCPRCGGEIIYEEDVVLDKCPYCGSVVKRVDALEYTLRTQAITGQVKKKDRGRFYSAVAVIGFFAIMFIAAFIVWKTGYKWVTAVGLVLMIGWAVFFSMKGK